jgi:hypothetical protein
MPRPDECPGCRWDEVVGWRYCRAHALYERERECDEAMGPEGWIEPMNRFDALEVARDRYQARPEGPDDELVEAMSELRQRRKFQAWIEVAILEENQTPPDAERLLAMAEIDVRDAEETANWAYQRWKKTLR